MTIERWKPGTEMSLWRPFRALEELEHHFDDLWGRSYLPSFRWHPLEERAWMPAIDVFEKDNAFIVKAEIPGMEMDDIDVSVEGDTLTIKGERKTEKEIKEEDYQICERAYGKFIRSITLPSSVDATKIEANYEGGVLEVTLPKTAEVKPKKVKISAAKKNEK